MVGLSEVLQLETQYSVDINGDTTVGLTFNPIGVRLGTVEVGTTQLGYALRVSGGTPLQVTYAGAYVSASNAAGGWAPIAARTAGSGYELFWRNTSGAYASWALNSTGGLTSYRMVGLSEVLQLETQYSVDINGDTTVGLTFNPKIGRAHV